MIEPHVAVDAIGIPSYVGEPLDSPNLSRTVLLSCVCASCMASAIPSSTVFRSVESFSITACTFELLVRPVKGVAPRLAALVVSSSSSIKALCFGITTLLDVSSNLACIAAVERAGVSGNPITPIPLRSAFSIFVNPISAPFYVNVSISGNK